MVESSIARDSKFVLPIHCGPEIGVASTKAFIGQMLVLYLLCIKIAKERKDITKDIFSEKINKVLLTHVSQTHSSRKSFSDLINKYKRFKSNNINRLWLHILLLQFNLQ